MIDKFGISNELGSTSPKVVAIGSGENQKKGHKTHEGEDVVASTDAGASSNFESQTFSLPVSFKKNKLKRSHSESYNVSRLYFESSADCELESGHKVRKTVSNPPEESYCVQTNKGVVDGLFANDNVADNADRGNSYLIENTKRDLTVSSFLCYNDLFSIRFEEEGDERTLDSVDGRFQVLSSDVSVEENSNTCNENMISVTIETISGSEFSLELLLYENIGDLKFSIYEEIGILPDNQCILINKNQMISDHNDDFPICDLGIGNGSKLFLCPKMNGGPGYYYDQSSQHTHTSLDMNNLLDSCYVKQEDSEHKEDIVDGMDMEAVESIDIGDPNDLTRGNNCQNDYISANECFRCKKRLRLTNNFRCKCTLNFCPNCRYSNVHGCKFDYFSDGQIELIRNNPQISKKKIDKF